MAQRNQQVVLRRQRRESSQSAVAAEGVPGGVGSLRRGASGGSSVVRLTGTGTVETGTKERESSAATAQGARGHRTRGEEPVQQTNIRAAPLGPKI